MIGRRNHKKSRNGCTECKRRKVKVGFIIEKKKKLVFDPPRIMPEY